MNVAFLETFYWLGTLKSVKATAAKMRIAQPVVSMRMAALQKALGVELYRLNGRSFELTPVGHRVFRRCEAIVPQASALLDDVRQSDQAEQKIRIGVTDIVAMTWLPEFLRLQPEAVPGSLSVTADMQAQLIDLVKADQLDVAFVIGPTVDPTLDSVDLCEYPVKWLGAPALVGFDVPHSVVDLARFPIIQTRAGSYGSQQVLDYFRWHNVSRLEGLTPNHWLDVGFGTMVCLHFASEGSGVTALPTVLATNHVRQGKLVELPIRQQIQAWELSAVFRRQHNPSLLERIIDCARGSVAHFASATAKKDFRYWESL